MDRTQVGSFHIHTDQTSAAPRFAGWCQAAGYTVTNFDGHPEGYPHFEPTTHRTLKLDDRREFDRRFAELEELASKMDYVGYLEGEVASRVIDLPNASYVNEARPFSLTRRHLNAVELFREGEIHLTFDADTSDERRVKQLLEAGLFGAYEHSKGVRRLVLTAQGYMRDIRPLAAELESFLRRAGGLVNARLKIEKAVAWKLFGISTADLPPIVDRIAWAEV